MANKQLHSLLAIFLFCHKLVIRRQDGVAALAALMRLHHGACFLKSVSHHGQAVVVDVDAWGGGGSGPQVSAVDAVVMCYAEHRRRISL